MQPSEYEIQREVENLRDIRRRSSAPGGLGPLVVDPDLPEQLSPTSQGGSSYWAGPSNQGLGSVNEANEDDIISPVTDDPSSLFWVPARLHPEIAPSEFSAFLKEHTRVAADGSTGLSRASSAASTSSLGRKRSMLRNQYKPGPNDRVDDEQVQPLKRNKSSMYSNVPQLTISDLQRLEELAEEASKSDDPSKLRSVLRRSMSLNVSPSVIDKMDNLPLGDEGDSPIIVPPQPLRRAARTKIRKPGIEGTGNTRFNARRRTSAGARAATMDSGRTSSDLSSSDHGDEPYHIPPLPIVSGDIFAEPISLPLTKRSLDDEQNRPRSLVTQIYDAYASTMDDEPEVPIITTEPRALSPPGSPPSSPPGSPPAAHDHPSPPPETPIPIASPQPVMAQPGALYPKPQQPQRMLSPPQDSPTPSRTPSPDPSIEGVTHLRSASDSGHTSSSPHKKDKDKKGLFKWGKSGKSEKEKEKEKDSGFFGSLFGGKKKQEDAGPSASSMSGRETAAALLGASKAKSHATSPSPQPGGPYARYPIHVERAIYRLSHIKLANPRRPLYEQVLISNLMFWYLGVINKTTVPNTPTSTSPPAGQPSAESPTEKERQERERREKEENEKEEHERAERERQERERAAEQQKRDSRRGTLNKGPQPGTPGRRAEMPVRSPQYEMQHRSMENEYNNYGPMPSSAPPTRTGGAPPPPSNPTGYQRDRTYSSPSPSQGSQYSTGAAPMNNFYYENPGPDRGGASSLPPGAMPPANVSPSWSGGSGQRSPTRSASPPARTPQGNTNRYAPSQQFQQFNNGGANGLKGRSLSATAVAPMNGSAGGLAGKSRAQSAHAVPARRQSEEEDVPLAVWQQQRRR